MGAINTLRASSFLPGSPEDMVSASRMALAQLGPELIFERSLAELWQVYGLQQLGHSAAAAELAQRWLDEQPGRPDVRTLRLLLALCGVYFDQADLPRLGAAGTTYRDVALQTQRAISLAWANFLLGYAHYYRNELEAAAGYFGRVVGSPYEAHGKAAVDGFIGLALTRRAQGQTTAARDVVSSLRAFLLDLGTTNFMPVADSLARRIGDQTVPDDIAGGAAGDLDAQMAGDLWELPGLTTVRAALRSGAPGRLAAAAETLRICHALADARKRKRRLIEISVLEACVHAAQGDDAAALAAVGQAVRLGEPGGALRFFLDDGTALQPYLRELMQRGVSQGYVRAILEAFPAGDAAPAPVLLLPSPGGAHPGARDDPAALLTQREMDVLLLLEQRLTNKEIAARLTISPRTVQKHTINLYGKLHASNRRDVIARARALGLL
jgi:LuxR family maltose regulon positive regulatory protein